jgi:hypothetical protein
VPVAVGGQHRAGRLPPSLNSQSRGFGSSPSRGSRRSNDFPFDEHNDNVGGFDAAAERDIMASVWR